MKIRYYLRGLGLGILVTAIFFMVSGKSNQTMSDEMIKARARELGMTESVVLSDLSRQEEETIPVTVEAEVEMTEEEVILEEKPEAVTEEAVEETIKDTQEESVEETSVEEEEMSVDEASSSEEAAEETSKVDIVEETVSTEAVVSNTESLSVMVNRGDGSDTVSKRLQEAGLVADAHEYDRYLMANGYDRRISVGEHEIPAGATWEDIAKILCNMK